MGAEIYTDEYGEYCLIPLTKGKYAKVDPADYEWLSSRKWYANKGGAASSGYYARTKKNNRHISMHRLLMDVRDGVAIDHRNGDSLDDRRGNLRVATAAENQRNKRVTGKGSSKYKGVCFHKSSGNWQVYLGYNRKKIYLGQYKTQEEAAIVYDMAAMKYYGEFARTNILKLGEDGEYAKRRYGQCTQ